jgi:DNA polymerase elongation subunit (family B)
MNASPETIIGYEDDLQQSEYTKDDCHVVYVDTRDEEIKRDSEPERTPLYVLKPSVKESFIREIIVDLIDLKYEYKSDEYDDEAYAAVKRITNSVYGVMGDSASYGVGFRLFDWRIAEAITLAGRDVIKHTADEFQWYVEQEGGYPNAQIIGGDTDSCVCSIPSADGMAESLDIAMDAAEYVDNTYDEFMQERFNISNNNMAVEIESYAERALFMEKKKRYAQRIRWDEGDEVDDIEFKGFELVRSDSAEMTADVQSTVLEQLLTIDDPKTAVSDYLREEHTALLKGNVELEAIGKPMSINKSISEYGSDNRRPQPHIRGAKWATQNLDGEDHSSGGKPKMFYVDAVRNANVSETYDAETAEDGDVVDAISVDDTSNIADGIEIDYEKMADKVLRSPIEPIFDVLNWSFEDMISAGSQNSLSQYM